ncbi:ROK family protein [Lactovum odontotermitis]
MRKETFLCVDLGGTKILVGELTKTGEILDRRTFISDISSQKAALKSIKEIIHFYLKNVVIQEKIVALSLDVVGRVDSERKVWFEIDPGNAEGIELGKELEQEFRLPVFVNNDVSSAAIAEKHLGIGRLTSDFVYLNVGTGIAGRTVSGGRLIAGGHFNAGEVGHTVVDMDFNKVCACGRYGCVESFASGSGLSSEVHRLRERFPTVMEITPGKKISGERILAAYQKQDTLAEVVIDHATRGIAELIMNLVRVSDPEAVVVGGGLMSNTLFYQRVLEKLNQKTMRFVKYGVSQTSIDPALIALKGCAVHANAKMKEGK